MILLTRFLPVRRTIPHRRLLSARGMQIQKANMVSGETHLVVAPRQRRQQVHRLQTTEALPGNQLGQPIHLRSRGPLHHQRYRRLPLEEHLLRTMILRSLFHPQEESPLTREPLAPPQVAVLQRFLTREATTRKSWLLPTNYSSTQHPSLARCARE